MSQLTQDKIDFLQRISLRTIRKLKPSEEILVNPIIEGYIEDEDNTVPIDEAQSSFEKNALAFAGADITITAIVIPVVILALEKLFDAASEATIAELLKHLKKKKKQEALRVELLLDEIEKELIIKVSGSRLSKRKSKRIVSSVMDAINEELLLES